MYYRILPTHAIPIVRITHIRQILSSANHPDDWLTVARWLTFCLSEYYDKKTDGLTFFLKISVILKIKRYLQLLLISIIKNNSSNGYHIQKITSAINDSFHMSMHDLGIGITIDDKVGDKIRIAILIFTIALN